MLWYFPAKSWLSPVKNIKLIRFLTVDIDAFLHYKTIGVRINANFLAENLICRWKNDDKFSFMFILPVYWAYFYNYVRVPFLFTIKFT